MANPEHVELLLMGSEVWEKWRKENPSIIPQLSEADLRGSNLTHTELYKADLRSALFTNANLRWTNLTGANLSNADFGYANLHYAGLKYANLSNSTLYNANLSSAEFNNAKLENADLKNTNLNNANLNNADLFEANLNNADLRYANLSNTLFNGSWLRDAVFNETIFYGTKLCNIDLSTVKGLESVNHRGPSTLGIDTYLKSHGNIPDVFLLGCGIPQAEIHYLRSMAMNPIEFHSCFISYSHKDENFAQRLHSNLRDNHLRVWYAPEDMKAGRKTYDQIDQAIQMHDKLLLILSEKSMKSDWVKTEIRKAHQREQKEKRQILFPISIVPMEQVKEWDFFDNDLGKSLSSEVRSYHIPDFSNWKDPASFEQAFSKLLRDLKGGKNTPRRPLPKLKG